MKRSVSPSFVKLTRQSGCPPNSYRINEDDNECHKCIDIDNDTLLKMARYVDVVKRPNESKHSFCKRIRNEYKARYLYITSARTDLGKSFKKRQKFLKGEKSSSEEGPMQEEDESDINPYDILYPALGEKLKSSKDIPMSIIKKHFKQDKLKVVFNLVLSKIGDDKRVWGDKFDTLRIPVDYEFEFEGFLFDFHVYRNIRNNGKRVIDFHMSNDGFMYGILKDELIVESSVKHHTKSKEWSRVSPVMTAFFNEELHTAFYHLKWKETDKIKVDGFYNRDEMRLDIVCYNETRDWEVSFCFEQGNPRYPMCAPQTLYSDIQKAIPEDWAP